MDNDCSGGADGDQDGDGYDSWRVGGPDCYDSFDDDYPEPADRCWEESELQHLKPAAVYPGSGDLPYDGTDADCSGGTDADADADGYSTCGGESAADCDDHDASVSPGAAEIPVDGIDNDCDGMEACYADADGDGYGAGEPTVRSAKLRCVGVDVSAVGTDCDDHVRYTFPGAPELCHLGDNDCDGSLADDLGTASFVSSAPGEVPVDVTAEMSGTYAVGEGELNLCEGTWAVGLVVDGVTATIKGRGPEATVLDGSSAGVALRGSDARVTMAGLRVTGGTAGGVSVSGGSLLLDEVLVSGNTSTGYGGGVFGANASIVLLGCTVLENAAGVAGGGVAVVSGSLSLVGTVVEGNTSAGAGGGIYADGSGVWLRRSDIGANEAEWGGGLVLYHSTATADETQVWGNVALGEGGGIYLARGELDLVDSRLRYNRAAYGGALHLEAASTVLCTDTDAADLVVDHASGNIATRGAGAWLAGSRESLGSSRCDWIDNLTDDGAVSDVDGDAFAGPYGFGRDAVFTGNGSAGCE